MALFTKIRERVIGNGNGNSLKFDSLEQISKKEDSKEFAEDFDKENTRTNHANISVFTKEVPQKPLIRTSSFGSSKKDKKFINILPNNENHPSQNTTPRSLPRTASFNALANKPSTQQVERETAPVVNKDNRFATSRTVSSTTLPVSESIKPTTTISGSSKSQSFVDENIFETKSDAVDESFESEDDYLEQIFSKTRHNHGPEVLEALRKGFDVNTIDSNGNTLMHICAQNNHRKLAASVLQRYPHCKVNEENFKGLTPLDYSQKYGFHKMTDWLSSVGAESGAQAKPIATMLR